MPNIMLTNESCFHCAEKIPAGCDYPLTINQVVQHFCCLACLGIAETIHAGGLDKYYQQRDSKPFSAPATRENRLDYTVWDNPELQKDFVSSNDGQSTAKLYIEGTHCTACAWLIEKHLAKNKAVISAQVSFSQQLLTVTWKNAELHLSDIMNAIVAIGYMPHPYRSNTIKELQTAELRQSLKQIGITAILMMQIGMFSIAIYAGEFVGITQEFKHLLSLFSFIFSLPLLYYSALPFFVSAFLRLKSGQLNIDVSISIAITGLYISSVYSVLHQQGEFYFDSISMFCLFILIARYMEKQSRMALLAPVAILPAIVTRIVGKNGEEIIETVSLNQIAVGDAVLIREGDVIPVDGKVMAGASSVSEAFLNGEPKPLAKMCGDVVFAGSQNHDGQLRITVIAEPDACAVKSIEALALKASAQKPHSQSVTDSIAANFTITIYTLAITTFVYWYSQGNAQAYWIALSVLVISCPCALSLAAPTALSAAQNALRKKGVLVQGSHVIETLNTINHVIFDKTGTLTAGRYRVSSISNAGVEPDNRCLQIASALESTSRHPLAKAFLQKGLVASDIKMVANRGIEGVVENKIYRMGSPLFCAQWHAGIQVPDNKNQWIGLCEQDRFLAWFQVQDTLRENARTVVEFLTLRLMTMTILSGDGSNNVEDVAKELGIADFQKNCAATEKLQALQNLQNKGDKCLVLGDGVNDAPVLSQSTVSATLLDSCDWVKNTADVVLLNNDLFGLVYAFEQARRYKMIVWQNFSWAILYNVCTIPLAMAGYVTPYFAAIGMSASSVFVVLNSRRLNSIAPINDTEN